jgi:glycosyltransferase involved in cell wall biosynthesis
MNLLTPTMMAPLKPSKEVCDASSYGRIAILSPSVACGGAERVMVNLAQGLVRRGLKIDVVLGCAEGAYLPQLPAGISIFDLKSSRMISAVPALVQYLRHRRPEYVISFQDHTNVAAIWACGMARSGTKTIATVHTTWSHDMQRQTWRTKVLAKAIRPTYAYAARVVPVSSGSAADLISRFKLPADLVTVVYNPVVTPELFQKCQLAPEHRWCRNKSLPLIVAVGRLAPEKDFATLIRAFAKVRARSSLWPRLLILGEGNERQSLEALIDDLQLRDWVDLPGFVPNPYAILRHADVFTLSSVREGLPTVLIEALALGIPVVATDCESGPREILNDGRHGLLAPVGDEEAFAGAIHRQLTNPIRPDPESWAPYNVEVAVDSYLSLLQAPKSGRRRNTHA